MTTHSQKLCNTHLFLVTGTADIGQRGQLHRRRPGRHQHHCEPQDGVVGENTGFAGQHPDQRDTDQWPDDKADDGDDGKWLPRHIATLLSFLVAQHCLRELDAHYNYLEGCKEVADVFDRRGQPGVEVTAFVGGAEEESVQGWHQADDCTNDGANKRWIPELVEKVESSLCAGRERVVVVAQTLVSAVDGLDARTDGAVG